MKKTITKVLLAGAAFILLLASGCRKNDAEDNPPPIAPDHSNLIEVTNPGNYNDIQPAIAEAINKADNGDTIKLPEGIFNFVGSITTSKQVSLMGQGTNNTVLYRSESITDQSLTSKYMLCFDSNSDNPSHIIISGFTLKSKKPADMNDLNGSTATDFGIRLSKVVDFIVTNCRFENFGYAALMIYHKDKLARGLIYNNQFYHNFKGDGQGLGYGVCVYSENLEWVNSPGFGSNNFIFIEDNTFEFHRHSVAAGGSGLYVARYNMIKNNHVSSALDMHEARTANPGGSNHFSSRAAEAYNNTIINTKYLDGSDIPAGNNVDISLMTGSGIQYNGGESVIHDNYISGYKTGVSLIVRPNSVTGSTYPVLYQIGYDSALIYGDNHSGSDENHSKGDSFVWNNHFGYINGFTSDNGSNKAFVSTAGLLNVERDYHLISKPNYAPYTYPHPLRSLVK